MSLANLFRPGVSNGFHGEAQHRPALAQVMISGAVAAAHRTNATAQLAASAAKRLNAAKAELEAARSASMRASLACKVAEGQKSAVERHELRLAHRAAKERLEIAHSSVGRCQSEFDAAFRNFQNVA